LIKEISRLKFFAILIFRVGRQNITIMGWLMKTVNHMDLGDLLDMIKARSLMDKFMKE
jgi:hypothetical protein